jgi:hypothetical protein
MVIEGRKFLTAEARLARPEDPRPKVGGTLILSASANSAWRSDAPAMRLQAFEWIGDQ